MKKYLIALSIIIYSILSASPVLANEATATVDFNINNISSYTIAKLEALIVKLQAQLAALKSGGTCIVTNKFLSLGDGDDESIKTDVKSVQNFLSEKGYFKYTTTGYFGKITMTAMKTFQKENGLAQSGELDDATRAKIKTFNCMKVYYKDAEVKKVETKTEANISTVTSISLSADGSKVKWVTSGISKNGFKVVWSKNQTPTYPNRDGDQYQYFTEPTKTTSDTLGAFNGSGTYYVRVCEYLGGACGVYSNEVTVSL